MRGFALRGTAPEVGCDRRRVTAMIRGWSWLRAIRRVGFRSAARRSWRRCIKGGLDFLLNGDIKLCTTLAGEVPKGGSEALSSPSRTHRRVVLARREGGGDHLGRHSGQRHTVSMTSTVGT